MASIPLDARVLLDHNVPLPMRRGLAERTRLRVETAAYRGWERLTNGDLLTAAEGAGFDLLITADKSLRYQQNMSGRRIAVVSLAANRWIQIQANFDQVVAAVMAAELGSFAELRFMSPPDPAPRPGT